MILLFCAQGKIGAGVNLGLNGLQMLQGAVRPSGRINLRQWQTWL
ncbi:MAG: hypothetical protein U1E47_07510 [Rivihabitans pingtungensis]